MNYKYIYDCLVDKCRERGLDKKEIEGYFEKHHIIPKCMGGSDEDENFVLFTPREHVIAHRLLWEAFPNNYSLMWAYTRTVNSHKGILTSREVEKAKLAKAEYMRNRVISNETKDKIRKTLTGHTRTPESVEKGRLKLVGQKRTEETKAKLRAARKELLDGGWTHSEDSRKKISEASKGRTMSQEAREKISQFNLGKIIPDEHKAILSEFQKSLRPWQKSASVARPARARVWAEASNSYDFWLEKDRPGPWSFSTLISVLHGVDYPKYHFDTMIKLFKEGWVPSEDPEWVEFHKEVGQ